MKDLASSDFAKLLDLDQDFNKGLGKTNLSLDQMRRKIEDLKVVKNLTTDVKELANANKAIDGLQNRVNMLSSYKGKGGMFDQFKEGVMNIPGMGGMAAMVTPVGATVAAVGAVTAAGVKGTKMAMDFEKGMAQVNTTARLSKGDLMELSEKLKETGIEYADLNEIPMAFNQIISATDDVTKSVDMFEPSLKAAKAGFTDVKTITESLTNTMGAVPGLTPTHALDTMFAAVRVGKAEFKDMAAYLPKVIPSAQRVGMAFEDTAGIFSMFTAKGQSVEQTAMLMENAFTALSKKEIIYGSNKKGGFKGLGIEIFDKSGEMRKIEDIAKDLKTKLAGKSDRDRTLLFSSIGLDAQASSAFVQLANHADELNHYLDATRKPAGEMAKAFQYGQNTSDRLATTWRRLVDGPLMEMGNAILPVFADFVQWINDAVDGTKKLWKESESFRATINLIIAPIKGLLFLSKEILNIWGKIFNNIPIGDFFRAIDKFTDRAIDKWDEFAAGIKNIFKVIKDAGSALSEGEFSKAYDIAKGLGNAYNEGVDKMKLDKSRKIADSVLGDYKQDDLRKIANSSLEGLGTKAKANVDTSGYSHEVNGARQNSRPTNFYINVDALAKDFVINSTTAEGGVENLIRLLNEKMLRVVSGANQLSLG